MGAKRPRPSRGPNGARKSAPVLGGNEKARQTWVTQELFLTRRAPEGPCPHLDRAAPPISSSRRRLAKCPVASDHAALVEVFGLQRRVARAEGHGFGANLPNA